MNEEDELVVVQLLELPPRLMVQAQERADELGREFLHVAETDEDSAPARLRSLSRHLQGRYGEFLTPMEEQIDAAAARGEESIDIAVEVPRSVRTAVSRLWALLEEADEFSRTGDLLTLAPAPEVLTLRRWYLTQFLDQIDGAQPVPFSRYAEPPPP